MKSLQTFVRAALASLACAVPLLLSFSARAQAVRELRSPAGPTSGQSNLAADGRGRVYLSWIERPEKGRVALRFAVREGAGWSAPRTIAEGGDFVVNWADFPSLAALTDGSLAAHWLVRNASAGAAPYAYDVHIARSFDGGASWTRALVPHRDNTPTEHGFVSMFPAPRGRLAAVWLDGRETKTNKESGGINHSSGEHGHGQMTLRYATVGRDGHVLKVVDEAVLDGRVCECCQTSAAVTAAGPVVVYRDRTEGELRDISIVRLAGGRWSAPMVVHADRWKIDGCPVNGPAVDAAGRRVAVAWFTMGDAGKPRVRLAFSRDAGASFSPPVEVDDGDPVGRTAVLLLADGSALVCWIERTKGGAEVRARRVRGDGRRDPSITIAPSGAARSSGFPRMARAGRRVIFSWTSPEGVRTAEMLADGR
jgi:hypothetical protein